MIVIKFLQKNPNYSGLHIEKTLQLYLNLVENSSLYNTPPTFAIYVAGLMFDWLLELGGVEKIADKNFEKSKLLYDTIDSSDFYNLRVAKDFRSKVNVPFFLQDEKLERLFISGANKRADKLDAEYSGDNTLMKTDMNIVPKPVDYYLPKLYNWYSDNKNNIDPNLFLY